MRLLLTLALFCFLPAASSIAQSAGERIPATKIADTELGWVTRRFELALAQAENADTKIVERFILHTTTGGLSQYKLIGLNRDGSVKVALLLKQVGDKFYLFPDSAPESVALACIGCDKRTMPDWKNGSGWSCGNPVDGGGKCTKITASEEIR